MSSKTLQLIFEKRPVLYKNLFQSGAVVLGWYASQLTCLRRRWEKPFGKSIFYNDLDVVPAGQTLHKLDINSLRNAVYSSPLINISNDLDNSPNSSTDAAEKEFKDVLRSIENKLGIIAIDGGQFEEGLDMLQSSAEKNYAPAIFNLAICYEKGLGVKKDEKMVKTFFIDSFIVRNFLLIHESFQAMELYRSAAVKNHPSAMYNLAVFYGQGRGGLTRDVVTANDLLRVAAAQGQKEAISALKTIKKPSPIVVEEEISLKPSPTDTFLTMIGCDQKTFKFKGNDTILSF